MPLKERFQELGTSLLDLIGINRVPRWLGGYRLSTYLQNCISHLTAQDGNNSRLIRCSVNGYLLTLPPWLSRDPDDMNFVVLSDTRRVYAYTPADVKRNFIVRACVSLCDAGSTMTSPSSVHMSRSGLTPAVSGVIVGRNGPPVEMFFPAGSTVEFTQFLNQPPAERVVVFWSLWYLD
jgi:hypothetical protein